MNLQNDLRFSKMFDEVCRQGRVSGIPSCSQSGYQVDSVSTLRCGQSMFFGKGRYDEWGVWTGQYFADGSYRCAMARDLYYFEILKNLGDKYGARNVYVDAKYIYDRVPVRQGPGDVVRLSPVVLSDIVWMSDHYSDADDNLWAEKAFMSVYYGMIAEENKINTQLGSAMKINGIYKLLMLGRTVGDAADDCRGVSAVKIYSECMSHGIFRDFP